MYDRFKTGYVPYGAFQMKATYQRNLLLANLSVFAVLAMSLTIVWLAGLLTPLPKTICGPIGQELTLIIAELGLPVNIERRAPLPGGSPPISESDMGIPVPVDDSLIFEEDVTIATRDEIAEYNALSDLPGNIEGNTSIYEPDEYLPEPDEFVPTQEQPKLIHFVQPKYPRLVRQAGIEGTVLIKALVGKDGSVKDAIVLGSSGSAGLDQAALAAAVQNRFSPAIQNGNPVAVWVTYRVEFSLDQ